MSWLWIVLRLIVGAYTILVALLYLLQERLIFHPSSLPQDFQFRFDSPVEEVYFDSNGEKLHTLLFHSPASKGVILYFHGNTGDLSQWGDVADTLFRKTAWSVWIVDYPGYGKSSGKIKSEAQLQTMSVAFYDMARSRFSNLKLGILGRSIGTGFASHLAAHRRADFLILETPFLSLPRLTKSIFPGIPTFLMRYHFDNELWIQNVIAPIYILHGRFDETVPYAHGVELSKSKTSIQFYDLPRAQHNNLTDSPEYWIAIEEILKKQN